MDWRREYGGVLKAQWRRASSHFKSQVEHIQSELQLYHLSESRLCSLSELPGTSESPFRVSSSAPHSGRSMHAVLCFLYLCCERGA